MSFRETIEQHPEYLATASLDDLRRREFARLDVQDHAYLDYTGAGLYPASLLRQHIELLESGVLGNPHSVSLASSASTALVENARRAVLQFFNAGDDYTAIFTGNASGALKLVGESYPFAADGHLVLTFDNHNSVNGIREFAQSAGAPVTYVPLTRPNLRIDQSQLEAALTRPASGGRRLFVYPAQSNFSGVKHPLSLIESARTRGWDVLLDAAAFVPTNVLDLGAVSPDFVSVSFYKMFGYPTGVGCLLARRSALANLRRPWFAGGTVNFATVQGHAHVLSPGEAGFEDGTLNYLSLPAVQLGLDFLQRVGIETIRRRVLCLTEQLLAALVALRHDNGRPMVRLYGPTAMEMRGATVTMNCYDPDGHLLDYRRIEELASQKRISLRTGCFCNPGAGEAAEALSEEDMRSAAAMGHRMSLSRFLDLMRERGEGKSAGAIRVSLGLATNAADVARFVEFLSDLRNQSRLALGNVTFDIESCRVIRDGS